MRNDETYGVRAPTHALIRDRGEQGRRRLNVGAARFFSHRRNSINPLAEFSLKGMPSLSGESRSNAPRFARLYAITQINYP
jgi:hypothetical protein